MNNPDHDLDLVVFGYCISKYLLTLSKEEALQMLSSGYSKEALKSLYQTAMLQQDYEICSILQTLLKEGH